MNIRKTKNLNLKQLNRKNQKVGQKNVMPDQNQSCNPFLDQLGPQNWITIPCLDPRDKKIIINSDHILPSLRICFGQNEQNKLRNWLVQMFENVTSDAFDKYRRQELKQGQVKAYTAKNYLFNIYVLFQGLNQDLDIDRKNQIFKFIDQESKQVIDSIMLKYPQSQAKGGVRKLKKTITRPDNRQSDQFDLLRFPKQTQIYFQGNYEKNYTSQIMKTLNLVMNIDNQPLHPANDFQTNFDGFTMMLQSIFTFAGCPEFESQFFKQFQDYKKISSLNLSKSQKFQSMFTGFEDKNKQLFQKYKKKINEESKFKINQKIPANVNIFSEREIEAGAFRVPSVSVLRVMTKWAEELRQKIQNSRENILIRVEPFKNKKGELIQVGPLLRQYLHNAAEIQEKKLILFLKYLKDQSMNMGTQLSFDKFKIQYSNDVDGNLGIFAARTNHCVGQYMLAYLNELIHSLLMIPIVARDQCRRLNSFNEQGAQILQSLDLITFKIGDLLRARCKASQKHIIQIYKMLDRMSQQAPQIYKIVRLKDRLNTKDNDLLINFFFMSRVQCQLQLSVNSEVDKKAEQYNSFNHFIYELKRAQLGPIAQCACILTQYDPVIKKYSQSQSLAPKTQKLKKQCTFQQRSQFQNRIISLQEECLKKLPFFCSVCNKFINDTNPNFYANKINCRQFKQCNNCYQQQMIKTQNNQKQLVKELIRQFPVSPQEKQLIEKHVQILNIKNIKQLNQLQNMRCLFAQKLDDKPKVQYGQFVKCFDKIYLVNKQFKTKKQKIIRTLSGFENWKKKLNSIIILKFKEEYEYTILNDKKIPSVIFNSISFNGKPIQIGFSFDPKEATLFLMNIQLLKDAYKKQKQVVCISNRSVKTEFNNFSQMKFLKRLYSSTNQLTDILWIAKIKNLEIVNLCQNQIKSLQGIQQCHNITHLKLRENYIQNLNFLENANKLKVLVLGDNKIKAITNLHKMKCLQQLYLNANQIYKIENLQNNEQLKILDLGQNKLKQIQNLQKLVKLQSLNLEKNEIGKIKNVNSLICLKKLILNHNQLQKIQNLNYLQKLQILYLNNNSIKKIQNLHDLTSIKQIYLGINKLQNVNQDYIKQLRNSGVMINY